MQNALPIIPAELWAREVECCATITAPTVCEINLRGITKYLSPDAVKAVPSNQGHTSYTLPTITIPTLWPVPDDLLSPVTWT
jgi:hypothetical protein